MFVRSMVLNMLCICLKGVVVQAIVLLLNSRFTLYMGQQALPTPRPITHCIQANALTSFRPLPPDP